METPSFAFNTREIQTSFFKDVTYIIHELAGGKQLRDHIYVNLLHTVDGAWNLSGQAMANEQLGAAISPG